MTGGVVWALWFVALSAAWVAVLLWSLATGGDTFTDRVRRAVRSDDEDGG